MRAMYIDLIILALFTMSAKSQNTMRVHYNNGTELDIPIAEINCVTFVNKDTLDGGKEGEVSLYTSWLWGNKEAGYYELLTFNDDYTYKGYDNYFTFGFDTMTYGWFTWYGNMLTLQSNGFGYRWMYKWFISGLVENALSVMTPHGPYTYYKLQPEVIYVPVSESYAGFDDSDTVVFADEVIVKGEENKLQALSQGTTYVLVKKVPENKIVAYKVIVK